MNGTLLIIAECRQGQLSQHSVETIVAAQGLAAEKIIVAIAGKELTQAVAVLEQFAINEIWTVQQAILETYSSDLFCAVFYPIIERLQPCMVLLPHSYQVRDFAPVLATKFGRSLVSDCINIKPEKQQLLYVRPLFQGRFHADVSTDDGAPDFVTLQSGCFDAESIKTSANKPNIENIDIDLTEVSPRVISKPPHCAATQSIDLGKADIIVAVGRGIKSADNIALAQTLATLLGAELAASRPICDEGWLPIERQIGTSGQTVSPKLYIALGISGAIQHVIGMKSSTTIVAINTDANAPIFKIADYGIVGDLFQIIPALIKNLEESGRSANAG